MSDGTEAPCVIDAGVLAPLLRSALGVQGSLAKRRIIRARRQYAVVDATLANPHVRVVVKLAGPEAAMPCAFERTSAINRLVRARTRAPTLSGVALP